MLLVLTPTLTNGTVIHMRKLRSAVVRRELDERFTRLRPFAQLATTPASGWIRSIRQSLGMNAAQLADRMGVSQPRVIALEKGEAEGAIHVRTLQRAAEALDCSLYYVLVPNDSLDGRVHDRARALAVEQITNVEHTMQLENQPTSAQAQEELLRETTEALAENPRTLWNRR
jgi:predicted DNA-binding mobile mystery protein A